MTADRIKTALVEWLNDCKPDADITVSDAQTFGEAELPRIAVAVVGAETHSPTLPGVQKVQLSVTLHAHASDDDTRAAVEDWCDCIEQRLNDPTVAKAILSAKARGLVVDHWLADGGSPDWDESVLVVTWVAEAWCRRVS
jgi:hypothetical protein